MPPYLVRTLSLEGFRGGGSGHAEAWSREQRLIEACRSCGEQHSILAEALFEQTKTRLCESFLAIYLDTSSKGGISAVELPRQLRHCSDPAAQDRPGHDASTRSRAPLQERVEAHEIPGRWRQIRQIRAWCRRQDRGCGQDRPKSRQGREKRPLGRLRLQVLPDAAGLEGCRAADSAILLTVTTGGWARWRSLEAEGYAPEAIDLVFSLAERWRLGTHHGAVRPKHLQRHLDAFVSRINRRKAKAISRRFARLLRHAVKPPPTTDRHSVHEVAARGWCSGRFGDTRRVLGRSVTRRMARCKLGAMVQATHIVYSDADGSTSVEVIPVLTGSCHCGALHWTLEGDPGSITVCNCTLCRRYGALWAYDYENERICISGPSTTYTRADSAHPSLEIHFCPACGCALCWRGLRLDEEGRRRIAVNIRLAPPEAVAGLTIDRFDGLDTFEDLPGDGRCVRDYWF